MDLVSKLVPLTQNLKSTAHFIFEKMELHDGVFKKKPEAVGVNSFSRFAQHCSGGIASWLPGIELRRSAFSGSSASKWHQNVADE